jgi:hypothetical protein
MEMNDLVTRKSLTSHNGGMTTPDDVETEAADFDEYQQDLDEEASDQSRTKGRANVAFNELIEEEVDPPEPEGDPDEPHVEPTPEEAEEMDRYSRGGRI